MENKVISICRVCGTETEHNKDKTEFSCNHCLKFQLPNPKPETKPKTVIVGTINGTTYKFENVSKIDKRSDGWDIYYTGKTIKTPNKVFVNNCNLLLEIDIENK